MTHNPIIFYTISALLLPMVAVGVYAVVSNIRRVPGEWRGLSRAQKTRLVVGLVAAVLYASIVVWMISAGIWVPLARGQEVTVTREQVLALELRIVDLETTRAAQERRIADLEAALQRMTNTFNPILHHGRTVEIWLSPPASNGTPPPGLVLTRDELGKVHLFVDGELHVQGPTILEDDLTAKGFISFDERKSEVHFTPRTAP